MPRMVVRSAKAVTGTFNVGVTSILPDEDTGNISSVAIKDTLAGPATVQQISIYVKGTGGQVTLSVYDNDGTSGGPGTLLARTAAFTPVIGWNTQNVQTPVALAAGDYWIAFKNESAAIGIAKGGTTYVNKFYDVAWGSGVPDNPWNETSNFSTATGFSIYATFSGTIPTPPPPPPPETFDVGITTILPALDSDFAGMTAVSQTLGAEGTLTSLSLHVETVSGQVVMAYYAADGPSGGPGTLLAQTDVFTPSLGWNTEAVQTPVELQPANYWAVYKNELATAGFSKGPGYTSAFYSQAWGAGALDNPWNTAASTNSTTGFSIYATFSGGEAPPPPANAYYFSQSGSDTNDGRSEATPKRSLAAATAVLAPGVTVLFKRGDVWYDPYFMWSIVNKHGTAANPITIGAYGSGPMPIIAAMQRYTTGWTNVGTNLWRQALGSGIPDTKRVYVNGVQKAKVAAGSVDQAHEYSVSGGQITVHNPTAPALVEVIPSDNSSSTLYVENCSYMTFRDIEFRGSGSWVTIHVEPPTDYITFDTIRLTEFNNYGLNFQNIWNPTQWHDHTLIQNCYINRTWSTQNNVAQNGGDNIRLHASVRNAIIRNNISIDAGHGHLALECINDSEMGIRNCLVERNEFYQINGSYARAFGIGGKASQTYGNVVRYNNFHDLTNSSHILGTGNYIYCNLFVRHILTWGGSDNVQSFAMDLLPWDFHVSVGNIIVHNTIVDMDQRGIMLQDLTGFDQVHDNLIANNLIVGWGEYALFTYDAGTSNDMLNNGVWNSSSSENSIYHEAAYTATSANAAFANYNGNVQVAPGFVDQAARNFRLTTSSAHKAAGIPITELPGLLDYDGVPFHATTPSIGAFQWR